MNEPTDDAEAHVQISERVSRLREAVGKARGPKAVAEKAGMAATTLNNYLAGRDMKVSALVALATACEVSVQWLATGDESGLSPSQTIGAKFPGFSSKILSEKAHFWALFILLRTCQDYHQQMHLVPSLAEVFEWVAPNYERARALPDARVEFKSPEEIGQ
jgi:transcriptional regulator with XRE-family HTH domain